MTEPTSLEAGNTLLHLASESNQIETVMTLVELGLDINATNRAGLKPFDLAFQNGHEEVATYLLQNGTRILRENIPRLYRQACQGSLRKLVSLFLDQGHCVNFIFTGRTTPLHIACHNKDLELCSILLSRGACFKILNQSDRRPIHLACLSGAVDIVKLLLDHGDNPNLQFKGEASPLHVACAFGQLEVVTFLLDNGADAKRRDPQGQLPLMQAILSGNFNVAEMFFSRLGMDVEVQDLNNNTSLHLACEAGYVHIVSWLIQQNANLMAVNHAGNTPLHLACVAQNEEIVKKILACGVELDAINHDNQTPLHLACRVNHCAIISLLLSYGADVKILDFVDQSPFDIALKKDYWNVVSTLLKKSLDVQILPSSLERKIIPESIQREMRSHFSRAAWLQLFARYHAVDSHSSPPIPLVNCARVLNVTDLCHFITEYL